MLADMKLILLNRFSLSSVLIKAEASQRITILPLCQWVTRAALNAHSGVRTLDDVGGG